jgi:hypothetical protein
MLRTTFILIAIIAFSSCDLFSPREAEPPVDTTDPYAWKPPTTPEIVLENLSNSFPAGKRNFYLDVLKPNQDEGQSFIFIPDPGVASAQPGVFDAWGYNEEENFITKLFENLQEGGFQRLIWEVDQISPIGDTYEVIADYMMTLSYTSGNGGLPTQLAGQSTLTMVQNSELIYEIVRWQDLNADTLKCWTEIKALVQ